MGSLIQKRFKFQLEPITLHCFGMLLLLPALARKMRSDEKTNNAANRNAYVMNSLTFCVRAGIGANG